MSQNFYLIVLRSFRSLTNLSIDEPFLARTAKSDVGSLTTWTGFVYLVKVSLPSKKGGFKSWTKSITLYSFSIFSNSTSVLSRIFIAPEVNILFNSHLSWSREFIVRLLTGCWICFYRNFMSSSTSGGSSPYLILPSSSASYHYRSISSWLASHSNKFS